MAAPALGPGKVGGRRPPGCNSCNTAPSNSIGILTARLPQLHAPRRKTTGAAPPGASHSTTRGLLRSTLRASMSATTAAPRAAMRSAHHHPKERLASRPTSASTPRVAPIPLRVPSPFRALLDRSVPTLCFAMARGARTRAETPAESIAETELSGAVPATRAWTDAASSTIAVTSRAATTRTDARASARWADCRSERSFRNRHTRLADPTTSASTSRPRPRTPRLPAKSPAVIDHAPTPRPQPTETMERASALCTRA
jgi:hypothetical protein